MEEQEKKELDLFDILRIFFKNIRIALCMILNLLTWFLRFLFQTKWILLGAIVCGVLFSLFWSRPDNLFYKGETEMRFTIYDAYFYKNQINLLNSYCEDENRTSLSNALQITMAEAYNLLSINSCFIIDLRSDGTPDEVDYANQYDAKKDTVNSRMDDRLVLVVLSKDTAIYSNLLGKIKTFLENNSIVSAENAIRLRHIDEKIVALDNEIYLLDSLRRKEYFKKESDTQAKLDQTILLSEKERRLYHDDILGLEGAKQGLRWEKEIRHDGVRLLAPFKIDPKPVNRLTKSLLRFTPPFLLLGFFVALAWRFRKEVYKFLSAK